MNYAGALSNFHVVQSAPVKHDNTTYLMKYDPTNVFSHNDGLGLRTKAFNAATDANTVSSAEIDSLRSDIQYGTFRTRATVPTVSPRILSGIMMRSLS